MRVLFACCVVFVSATLGFGPLSAQERQGIAAASSCDQCSTLVEQHEVLVRKITSLRERRKSLDVRENSLVKKRQLKQEDLLKLQVRHADLQRDELLLAQRAAPKAKTMRTKLVASRKTIERDEIEIRADLTTLSKAVPQARAATQKAERALDAAISERQVIMEAMANCEQRCIVADGPGTIILTAASLADVAQSNQTAIRRAARNNAACRDCSRLRDQIEQVSRRITERQNAETALRKRMTALDRRRVGIRNEWRDLYDRYSDRLVARLNDDDGSNANGDRQLTRIRTNIVDVNRRWQRLLTREGDLQDQLMKSTRERGEFGAERRRLRAALGACEELCVAGKPDPANTGLRLASGRINVAKAEAKCSRCGSLARLVNDATTELGTLTTERDTLTSRFERVGPALEQIQARRRSIIKYAGELADLMEDFRETGDVARAKRELAQISARSQRLSTDIIRLLDQRDKLEQRVDTNADAITRLSILSRQRRRELQDCEARCNAPDLNAEQFALARPDLTFKAPVRINVRCTRCQTHGVIVDQLMLLEQSEQASLTVAEGQLKIHQANLTQIDRALQLNAQSIRDAKTSQTAQGRSEQRNLIRGLEGEARAIRDQRKKLRTTVESAGATRATIRNRLTTLARQIQVRREALQACESSCRIVADRPAATLARAQSVVATSQDLSKSCTECTSTTSAMNEFAADVRSDSSRLELAIRSTATAADRVTGTTRRISDNRNAVLRSVRRWYELDDNEQRAARTTSVIGEGVRTGRMTIATNESAGAYIKSATARDQAQISLVRTLPSLESAIKSARRCAESCQEKNEDEPEFDISEFQEKNPAALIVKATRPTAVISRCTTCRDKTEILNRLLMERANAAANVGTARNITRSAGIINRQIASRNRALRGRVATLIQQRFAEENTQRKNALKKRLDVLDTQTRQLDRAKQRQDQRLRKAASDIDAARQDIRRLDREIVAARTTLRECENQCSRVSEGDDDQDGVSTGSDKDVARLPGATAQPSDEGDAGTTTDTNVADSTNRPTNDTDEGSENQQAKAPTKCKRCLVFSKRVTTLSAERNARRTERDTAVKDRQKVIASIRANGVSNTAKRELIATRRKLTRLIEARNGSIDRVETRLRRLRVSLERCEQVCRANDDKEPQAIASNNDADPDTISQPDDADVDTSPGDSEVPRTRRRKSPDMVLAETNLPKRKKAPTQAGPVETIVSNIPVVSEIPRVFGSLETLVDGNWETTVDIAFGTGNVWAPETATLSIEPASGNIKLDATTFAATITARDVSLDGENRIAWGSLKITRADGSTTETNGGTTATRTADYRKIRGIAALGRETYDCLEGHGSCALGLMAGVEHTSYDESLTGATNTQTRSVDNTAALAGVWGQIRVSLGGFDATGLALILKGDAYVKGGYASGQISTAAIAGTTHAKATSGYLGVGADLAAELEVAFDQASIAIGGEIGVDTLPTLTQNAGATGIGTDSSTSSTIYLRGKVKF